ncbi:MAG: efflux RND transporter periplasmic adaptor subunit [Bryobacterales bacterium]|nr:efflux RND transporter periplasmic adaptor subunit [Bryobacterales bacterium]
MWCRKWSKLSFAAGLISAVLILYGCRQTASAPIPAPGPTQVGTVTLNTERIVLTTELPGRTSAFLVAEIRPQVSGLIKNRLFEEGANVKAGDLLYQIDPAPYEAVLNQAKAALTTAEAELVTAEANLPAIRSREQRLKGLVVIHAVSQQDYDDASAALRLAEANLAARKAAVEISRAAVETASINLSYTPIKAPISGRIGISNVTVGAMATAYQPIPLAVIQQLDPIYVDVVQSNADLLRLRSRSRNGGLLRSSTDQRNVKLLLEDGTEYPSRGTLQFRDVTVDPSTGTVKLRMVFRNPGQVLLPGMFVQAVVEEGVSPQAILAPQQGVTRDNRGQPIAWVVGQGEKVEQKALELDRPIGDKWLVTGGLAAGDRLIVEGRQKVRPGMPVQAVPATTGAGGSRAGGRGPGQAEGVK